MSPRPLLTPARGLRLSALATVAALAVAACAPVQGPGVYGPAGAVVFNTSDFEWSRLSGNGGVDGQVSYREGGQSYGCVGAVALTPDTPYTRQRMQALYGSSERAAIPAAVVRARAVQEARDDYSAYVRETNCDGAGRFRFANLPGGSWFVITPVRAGSGEPVVLMRRVQTRPDRSTQVILD
ncbi:MAG: hypothetical protein ACK4E3_05235 [Brevundimonas sp.]|jgi:hypothetical protein|uniref:hypothetical protein n=1 Tax=Brevundimonas sp. TaxID=1871086 RepID=UPI00391DB110